METLIQTFVAVIIAVLGSNGLWAYLQSRCKATSARDRMLLGLGHAEIFRTAEKYIQRGGITTDELEDLEKYLYKPYSELGGNGTAQAIVEKCKQLKIISASEAERMDANGQRILEQVDQSSRCESSQDRSTDSRGADRHERDWDHRS